MLRQSPAKYLISFLAFLLGLFGAVVVIFTYSPSSAPWYVHAALYFSIFLAGTGLGALALLFSRRILRFGKGSGETETMRQALILGALAAVALGLQALRLLNVFTVGLLVLCVGILELYFLSR